MIIPTVGRIVWYTGASGTELEGVQPLAAIVCYVNSDTNVNLVVFDKYGRYYSLTQVVLVQEGEEAPNGIGYAQWMPYQIQQAKGN